MRDAKGIRADRLVDGRDEEQTLRFRNRQATDECGAKMPSEAIDRQVKHCAHVQHCSCTISLAVIPLERHIRISKVGIVTERDGINEAWLSDYLYGVEMYEMPEDHI